jgi:hypothetical protein
MRDRPNPNQSYLMHLANAETMDAIEEAMGCLALFLHLANSIMLCTRAVSQPVEKLAC